MASSLTGKREFCIFLWINFRINPCHAGRRIKLAPVKSLDSSEFSSEFSDLKTLSSNVKVNPVISWIGHNSFHRIFPSNSQDFHFIGFFLRILSKIQDFTASQTAFLKNHCAQTIGKFALFEKSCHNGKEEARTGWSNVDRVPQKIGRKSYRLDQFDSK